jgi:hypothetical protein
MRVGTGYVRTRESLPFLLSRLSLEVFKNSSLFPATDIALQVAGSQSGIVFHAGRRIDQLPPDETP